MSGRRRSDLRTQSEELHEGRRRLFAPEQWFFIRREFPGGVSGKFVVVFFVVAKIGSGAPVEFLRGVRMLCVLQYSQRTAPSPNHYCTT